MENELALYIAGATLYVNAMLNLRTYNTTKKGLDSGLSIGELEGVVESTNKKGPVFRLTSFLSTPGRKLAYRTARKQD